MKLLSSLVGLISLAGVVGGALYLKNGNPETQDPLFTYLLVKKGTETSSTPIKNIETNQKYFCSDGATNASIDKECQLIKINFDATNKSIDIKGLKELKDSVSEYSEINDSSSPSYFLLKTNSSELSTATNFKVLEKIESAETTQKTTSFSVLGKFTGQNEWAFEGQSNMILAKLENAETYSKTRGSHQNRCQLTIIGENENQDKHMCSIHKVGVASGNPKTLNFSSLTSMNDFKDESDKSNFYLIALGTNQTVQNSDKEKTKVIYYLESSMPSTESIKVATFTIDSLLIANGQAVSASPKNVIILKNS